MKFEDVGPLQVLVVGFDSDAEFSGAIVEELERLITSGTIRVIDLRFLTRVDDDTITEVDLDSLDDEERAGFGQVIDSLREIGGREGAQVGDSASFGPADIDRFVSEIEVGQSVGILLFEHTWATQLKSAIRDVGGTMIAQGLLTPEAALMVGEEVAAIAEAEATIELAAAVSGAAMLDAAAAIADAEDIKAAAAIDAIRALIASEVISDIAATDALESLVDAELISAEAVSAAAEEVLAKAEETEQALDALAAAAEADAQTEDAKA
ncbi:hypothetical protein FOE78_11695 [Microlunatus elymi]|uniref:DUF1269 domain-containing protein n=1 Tax=Microlunatus elymi TaxID=2596828 RepID=A0A516PZ88_9ACTN|nr:hypothetical protein [Microlunatus elymi]QDP96478.1 hypothetical protein FOE78_11695 [Microlunatus elymi]